MPAWAGFSHVGYKGVCKIVLAPGSSRQRAKRVLSKSRILFLHLRDQVSQKIVQRVTAGLQGIKQARLALRQLSQCLRAAGQSRGKQDEWRKAFVSREH